MAKNWLKPNSKYVNARASKKPAPLIETKIDVEGKKETVDIIREVSGKYRKCHLVFYVKNVDVYMIRKPQSLGCNKNIIDIKLHQMGFYTSNEGYIINAKNTI